MTHGTAHMLNFFCRSYSNFADADDSGYEDGQQDLTASSGVQQVKDAS